MMVREKSKDIYKSNYSSSYNVAWEEEGVVKEKVVEAVSYNIRDYNFDL
jgi:hypothetical protein